MPKRSTSIEGIVYTSARLSSAAMLLWLSGLAARSASAEAGLIVAALVLLPSIASAVDGGSGLGFLTYASQHRAPAYRHRYALATVFAAWSVVCSLAYTVAITQAACWSKASSLCDSLIDNSIQGIPPWAYVLGLAVCIFGTTAQRGAIAFERTRMQALTSGLLCAVAFLAIAAGLVPLLPAVWALVVALSLGDIFLFLWRQPAGELQQDAAEVRAVIREIAGHAGFFGILQLVAVAAYLTDLQVLAGSQPQAYVTSYAFFQRLTLSCGTAFSMALLPLWRDFGKSVRSSSREARVRETNHLVGMALKVAVVVFPLYLSALHMVAFYVGPKIGSIELLGFALQLSIGIVGAAVGIPFVHSKLRNLMLLLAPLSCLALFGVKMMMAKMTPEFIPLVSSLVVLVLSVIPQYWLAVHKNE